MKKSKFTARIRSSGSSKRSRPVRRPRRFRTFNVNDDFNRVNRPGIPGGSNL